MTSFSYMDEFFQILKEELVPALGCTEPIAIAYAGAKGREVLGEMPDKVIVRCSGSLIKNIRCVTVPNTCNLVGIEASVLSGIVGGDSSRGMEVLGGLSEKHLLQVRELLYKNICKVELLKTPLTLHFTVRLEKADESCEIEIKNLHTNITKITKNNKVLFTKEVTPGKYFGVLTDRLNLTVERIVEFSTTADYPKLKEILSQQVACNMAIAEKGLEKDYGVSIGKAILKYDPSIYGKMKAYSATASEARMCGCDMPVITNSGSGNQGIATSIPVILYSQKIETSQEKMYRALALSNLLTIYQKSYIGRLSAFCGAICACCSSGAAITYLDGGNLEQIKMTVINALADVSGVVCDGAKASCASKIATGLDASFIGHFLAMEGKCYNPWTGILGKDADETITTVGRMACDGMKDTDRVILKIMMEK